MLVVPDTSKLSQYGFKQLIPYNIWELVLFDNEISNVALLVNSFEDSVFNEIKICCMVDNTEMEQYASMEILFDMIKDGVVIKIDG